MTQNRYLEDILNRHIIDRGITISAISEKTGIPNGVLYNSLRRSRKLRGDEFLAVCDFIGIDPKQVYQNSA